MKKIITIMLGFCTSICSYAQTNDFPVCIDSQSHDTAQVDTTGFSTQNSLRDTLSAQKAVTDNITLQQKILTYIRNVSDKAVYTQNITSSLNLGLKGMGHSLNLDGKLQMRRDAVIRICIYIPYIGMEIARLEFTPTYVLLLDRHHNSYVKASYEDVAFLKSEGLTFYTLQSLFWNELFQPGKKKLNDSDFLTFTADISNPAAQIIRYKTPTTLYRWNTDNNDQIIYAGMTYGYTGKNYSTVMVNYGNFTALGVKQFPKKLYITFNSKAFSTGTLSLNMDMNSISTDNDWDAETNVSDRYTKITPEEFFKQLGSM